MNENVTLYAPIVEMEYFPERKNSILAVGEYLDCPFAVISFGSHPCAYVGVPIDNAMYGKDYDEIQIFENELTYADRMLGLLDPDGDEGYWWIGWDHAHIGDFLGYGLLSQYRDLDIYNGKKWTTEEMVQECIDAIDILKEAENE